MSDDEFPPWIDRVAGWAGALGMNKVRVRWKLQRWHNERRRPQPVEQGGGIGATATMAIAILILAAYVRTAAAAGGLGDIPTRILILHGANLPDGVLADEPWRLATSVFLHAGILHLAFNLLALAMVGRVVEELYGRWATLFGFLLTGVVAAFASQQLGLDAAGVGASGAVCGLIGIAAAAGHRLGTSHGIQLRNDMLKWLAYVLIFGFVIGADNRAHAGGFVAGGLLGLAVPAAAMRKTAARRIGIALGVVALLGSVATVAAILYPHMNLWEMLALTRDS